MSKLKEFLYKNRISYKTFAEMVGSSVFTIHGVVNGVRLPTLELALAIEKQTFGVVTPYDYELKIENKKETKTKEPIVKTSKKSKRTSG